MMLFSATAVATCLISIYVHPLEIATTLLTVSSDSELPHDESDATDC